jgi:decaprenylphospho-beta-D-erythro-pentofuranosid-2-ulose 2-reductase
MRNAVGSVQSALVLGGGSDLAVAIAAALAGRGCRRVVLAARRPDALAAARRDLEAAGATDVSAVSFDATDLAAHGASIERAWAGGDIDLVLVAFGRLGAPTPEPNSQGTLAFDVDDAVATTTTNYTGALSAILHATARLQEQGHGTLVVLSSVAGERVRASNVVYGASKAGLDGFALGLGDALVGTGVRVMVVRPGFVHTRMTAGMAAAPLAVTAERVAADVLSGLERDAEIVWSPGLLRWVMVVLRHVPRRLFRKLPL